VPNVVFGESVPLLTVGEVPMEYRLGVVLAGDSVTGESGDLVLGLLEDRNLALADAVGTM
jgi:hypothetical protein